MNVDQFVDEATLALDGDVNAKQAFIEKWVPIVTNTVPALQQRICFLELELTEAQGEQEL